MSTETSNSGEHYHFVLYIDSTKPKCFSVADRVQTICRDRLSGSYTLDIIDLQHSPALFERDRVIAVPSLDIRTPEGLAQRFVGDMTQSEMFIIAISLMQEARKMSEQAQAMRHNIKPPG